VSATDQTDHFQKKSKKVKYTVEEIRPNAWRDGLGKSNAAALDVGPDGEQGGIVLLHRLRIVSRCGSRLNACEITFVHSRSSFAYEASTCPRDLIPDFGLECLHDTVEGAGQSRAPIFMASMTISFCPVVDA